MRKTNTTAEAWLEKRKWKKFLLAIPLNKTKGYPFAAANDLNVVRVRAYQLNADTTCDRKFSVIVDFDTKVATITATLKEAIA